MEGKKLEYKEQELVYDLSGEKLSYTFGGIESKAWEKLQPEEHQKIVSFVKEKDAEYRKIEEEKKAAEIKAKVEELNVKIKAFKSELEKNPDIVARKLVVVIEDANERNYYYWDKRFSLKLPEWKNTFGNIHFDNRVYSAGSFYSSATTKVWCLVTNDRTIRFSDLDRAIKKYIEKIDEKIEKTKRESKKAEAENKKESLMKQFCLDNNLTMQKYWNRVAYGSDRSGYYTYHGAKINMSFSLDLNKGDVVVISSVTINKPDSEMVTKLLGKE